MTELINNINLENDKDYQALYSSQLYGTFFMVYGKFKAKKSQENSNAYHIQSLKLRILNYKGPVDLKIQDAQLLDLKTENYVEKDGALLKIKVGIMGGGYEYDVTNFPELNLTKDPKNYLYVKREVKAMSKQEMNETGIFDNEYYYREGFTITEYEDDIKIEQKIHDRVINPSTLPDDEKSLIGGKRCPNSKNFII